MVQRIFRKRHTAVGARPGTLVIDKHAKTPTVRLFEYSAEVCQEQDIADPGELRAFLKDDSKLWVDVCGLGDEGILRAIGETLGMHRLALEDVVNVPQRPKVEPYDEHLLIVTRMVRLRDASQVEAEQVSILIGTNYVVTFQERHGDLFEPVRLRLRQGKGPMRRMGPDYLGYAILDTVIDGYYPLLEGFGEHLESLEDRVVATPEPSVLREIHRVKRDLLTIRRGIWPQREAVNTLIRDDTPFMTEDVRLYMRDCYDHCVQIMDAVETYRELAGGLMDVYLSSVGNRQNEVMKVLTVMASIFIPLTFLAGIYGMNFDNMPELHSRWGYPMLLFLMTVVAVGMSLYFYRKGWIGSSVPKSDGDDV